MSGFLKYSSSICQNWRRGLGLLIVLEGAHILRLLTHPCGDRFNRDEDADFCVVLIHHMAEGVDAFGIEFA